MGIQKKINSFLRGKDKEDEVSAKKFLSDYQGFCRGRGWDFTGALDIRPSGIFPVIKLIRIPDAPKPEELAKKEAELDKK